MDGMSRNERERRKEKDRDGRPREGGLLAAGICGSLKHCELFLNRD